MSRIQRGLGQKVSVHWSPKYLHVHLRNSTQSPAAHIKRLTHPQAHPGQLVDRGPLLLPLSPHHDDPASRESSSQGQQGWQGKCGRDRGSPRHPPSPRSFSPSSPDRIVAPPLDCGVDDRKEINSLN